MSACSIRNVPNGPRTPVKVNGVVISRALISREVQNHPAPTPAAAWKAATLALVIKEALSQEAKRLGIEGQAMTDEAGRRETDEEANMRSLVEQEISTPEASDEECRRYYERNVARFRSADIYQAAHILIGAPKDDPDAFAAARERAAMIISTLTECPEAFEDLARTHSACSSASAGGNLGQITTGQTTPDFEAALVRMMPGEISAEPVATRYGFHVVRLDRKLEGTVLPYEIVRERIATYLSESVTRRAQAQFVARLLGSCQIEGIEIPSPGEFNVH